MSTVSNLYRYAGGLNIEGGSPWYRLKHHNPDRLTLWSNVILVLDRPLVDHILFDELAKDDRYPLLENKIDQINEHQFIATFLAIIDYYYNKGHDLMNIPDSKRLVIGIHFHQDVTCQPLIDIINKLLAEIYTPKDTIIIKYFTDHPDYTKFNESYEGIDILLSFSQCAGLDPDYPPGSLLISDTFIPFDLNKNEVCLDSEYRVVNDLIEQLDNVIHSRKADYIIDYVNSHYTSNNPNKVHKAIPLDKSQFIETKILQVDRLWNPVNANEKVSIAI